MKIEKKHETTTQFIFSGCICNVSQDTHVSSRRWEKGDAQLPCGSTAGGYTTAETSGGTALENSYGI